MSAHGAAGRVSVVIGAYNAAAWIGATLESVFSQTHPVAEVVVVDDGSMDRTADIVRSFRPRVQLLAEEHRGRPHRNRGILACHEDLVAFVDADDIWHPSKIARQLQLMTTRNTEWVYCESDWLDDATGLRVRASGVPVQEGDILESLLLNNFIVASTPMVTRRALEEAGYFEEGPEVAPVEDWDLWLRIAARHPIACVHEKLVTLRLHPDSFLARTPLAQRVQGEEHVIVRAVAREPLRLSRLQRRALSNVYHAAGVSEFRNGRMNESRTYFRKAWRQTPTRLESAVYVLMTYLGVKTSGLIVRLKRHLDLGK